MPKNNELASDDDIQFLSFDHSDKVICQMCVKDLSALTLPQKEHHYEEHFSVEDSSQPRGVASSSDASGGSSVKSNSGPRNSSKSGSKPPRKSIKSGWKGQSIIFRRSPEGKNIFWHSSQTAEPPSNFSPGMITVLKKALTRLHDRGTIQRARLAFEHSVHVHCETWDLTWGCGYRNYLMACAALLDQQVQPMYFPLLDAPVPPGIRNVQKLLETAWRDGYDEEGANEFNHKLVDTSKWIGTADLYVAFAYQGIPAQLVDFELKHGPEPLVQWIYDYFSAGDPPGKADTVGDALRGARPVIVTEKLPIILQHEGHSRTIIGCVQLKGGTLQLLTFDPAKTIPHDIRRAGLETHDTARLLFSGSSLPSKALQKVKRTVEHMKSHKRKFPQPCAGPSQQKRVDDEDVIVITDDDEDKDRNKNLSVNQPQRSPPDIHDPMRVFKFFRINTRNLKEEKYQILYFPLEEPLTDVQKLQRRNLTGEKVSDTGACL